MLELRFKLLVLTTVFCLANFLEMLPPMCCHSVLQGGHIPMNSAKLNKTVVLTPWPLAVAAMGHNGLQPSPGALAGPRSDGACRTGRQWQPSCLQLSCQSGLESEGGCGTTRCWVYSAPLRPCPLLLSGGAMHSGNSIGVCWLARKPAPLWDFGLNLSRYGPVLVLGGNTWGATFP